MTVPRLSFSLGELQSSSWYSATVRSRWVRVSTAPFRIALSLCSPQPTCNAASPAVMLPCPQSMPSPVHRVVPVAVVLHPPRQPLLTARADAARRLQRQPLAALDARPSLAPLAVERRAVAGLMPAAGEVFT